MATAEAPIRFLNNWFRERTQPIWEKHLLCLAGKIDTYLEIGMAEGASMRWVLETLRPRKAIGIDPYIPPKERQSDAYRQYADNMQENLDPWFSNYSLCWYREKSQDVLRSRHEEIGDQSIDLAYIDGDHRAVELMTDICLLWPKLKKGGWMVIDDFQRVYHAGKPLVRVAVRSFEWVFDNRYSRVWQDGRQLCYERIK